MTVTCLMPGATETEFFARANMLDTAVGQGKKDDAADVASIGFSFDLDASAATPPNVKASFTTQLLTTACSNPGRDACSATPRTARASASG